MKNILKKIKHKKLILITSSIGIILIAGSVATYVHYENTKPVGTVAKNINTKNETINNANYKSYNQLINKVGNNNVSRSWSYLFESQIKAIKNKGKKEMPNPQAFQNSLMTLIQSGQSSDINQGAALYTKNISNYNFTSNDNLINVGLGQDISIYNKYLSLISNMSIESSTSYMKNMGRSIKENFHTPMSMAVIGSQILPQGQSQFILSQSSILPQYGYNGTIYHGTKQYTSIKEAAKATKTYSGTDLENQALNAWQYEGEKTNSIYEVSLSDSTNTEKIKAYIIENGKGQLTFWGYYSENKNDKSLTLQNYQNQIEAANTQDESANDNDISWSNFQKETQ